ncbi:hypothetical protein K469DRAFT_695019 [Zopfia rhizophila CBS 207.26]|uniref:Uncharacterized protein n=1 Tax=Zopfia rhizophila CBS 207.26 TaxID=1314779 RepID=A0A6A6DHU4_9PEZI|nr:hypothetical protein K469DRAFT_695019 [Zopfia rhizophila CBS 207.26]
MALPTRLKVDIRDHWTKEDAPFQKASKSLSDLLGYRALCEPEWHMLWTELRPYFSDMSTFVPSVSSTMTAWCKTFTALLDEEKNAEWTEQVLEELPKMNILRIRLEVGGDEKPMTRWTADQKTFIVYLPKCGPSYQPTTSGVFRTDFLDCFRTEPARPTPLALRSPLPDDSWADIEVDTATGNLSTREGQAKTPPEPYPALVKASLHVLPDISTLERPEYLMLKPPYHLIITHSTYQKEIIVQCSHPPTLKVIEGYFKRWTKLDTNTVNDPPAAEIFLRESPFGLSSIHDQLVISMQNSRAHFTLSITFLLSFVEGVLGYVFAFGDGGSWTFRREIGFK